MTDVMQAANEYLELCRRFDREVAERPYMRGLSYDGFRFEISPFTVAELENTGFITVKDDVLTIHLDGRTGIPQHVSGYRHDGYRDWIKVATSSGFPDYKDSSSGMTYSWIDLADFEGILKITFDKRTPETTIVEAVVYAQPEYDKAHAPRPWPYPWIDVRLDMTGLDSTFGDNNENKEAGR